MTRGFHGQHGEALPLPGEHKRGLVDNYRVNLLPAPSLPIRISFRNLLPSAFRLLHQGMGTPITTEQVYRGLAPSKLFPMIRQRQPWED